MTESPPPPTAESPPKRAAGEHVGLDLSIDSKTLNQLLDRFTHALRTTIAEELAKIEARRKPEPTPLSEQTAVPTPPAQSSRGVEITEALKLKAADLRKAVLLGKVPEATGVLIDTKVTAKLLNVSARTLYRLDQVQAVPEPVRIAGKLTRWRLAEILEWIDSNCPPRQAWNYPSDRPPQKKSGSRKQ